MSKYDLIGKIRLFYSLVTTKIFYKKARLIRQPFDIRGKEYIELNYGFTCGFGCRLEAYPKNMDGKTLIFGKNVQINDYVHITAREKVLIEDNVLIASKVFISDLDHGYYSSDTIFDINITPIERKLFSKPVIIHKNVWIGENVSILSGVEIGENSIIGAGSVVTKSIPMNTIAVGNPAIVVKKYNEITKKWEKI